MFILVTVYFVNCNFDRVFENTVLREIFKPKKGGRRIVEKIA
jgi:hypothetical protein